MNSQDLINELVDAQEKNGDEPMLVMVNVAGRWTGVKELTSGFANWPNSEGSQQAPGTLFIETED